ncbi:MAG: SDR family oxidoreductase [Gemmatimonadetes bacterium]|nr:SDR family oxidoreductase [Gemmatimonadota bacterium]
MTGSTQTAAQGTVVIYGGNGGIGAATARRLHARGTPVHLVGRNADALAAVAAPLGAGVTVGDVTDAALGARVLADLGGDAATVAGLVYAVGTLTLKPLARLTADDFAHDYAVNVTGAASAVRALLPSLQRAPDGGAVVLFSSVAASQGFAFHASIGAAKAAVSGLTLALAAELAPKVRVNAVAPSLTATPLAARLLANEKTVETLAAQHPLRRLGTADDVAALAAFLVSSDASWMTGQIVGVDGGRGVLRLP